MSADLLTKVTPTVLTGAKVLCYGDSLTAGYCPPSFVPYANTLGEGLGLPCDHAGMCGWTTKQMLDNADSALDVAFGLGYPGLGRLLKSGNYSVVILMAGTNDLGFRPASEIADNLGRLHDLCHQVGVKTVAVSVPQSAFASDDSPAGRLSLRAKQNEVNSLLRQYVSRKSDLCFYADMEGKVPWSEDNPDWMSDGLHMSQTGYEKFGRELAPLVQEFVAAVLDDK